MTHKPTPEERAAERFRLNHDSSIALIERHAYAACLREVADPLEAERDSLRETVQVLVDASRAIYDRFNRTGGIAPVITSDEWQAFKSALARAAEKHSITPKP